LIYDLWLILIDAVLYKLIDLSSNQLTVNLAYWLFSTTKSLLFYRPRFGSKKKATLATTAPSCATPNAHASIEPESTESIASSTTGFSSQDLLNRMKTRNRLLGLPTTTQFQSPDEEEHMILNSTTPLEFATDVDYKSMLDDIRNFVAFRGQTPGQVTTNDILTEFNQKLPTGGAPMFRALLKQICTFSRDVHNQGIWQLNPEFQWDHFWFSTQKLVLQMMAFKHWNQATPSVLILPPCNPFACDFFRLFFYIYIFCS